MAKLLFKLHGVPEDEADDVRHLLTEAGIPFYETSAGNWGVSLAAIWLPDESLWDRAQSVLEEYQQSRLEAARHQSTQQPLESFMQRLWRAPLQVIAYGVLILAILYISIVPFLGAWSN